MVNGEQDGAGDRGASDACHRGSFYGHCYVFSHRHDYRARLGNTQTISCRGAEQAAVGYTHCPELGLALVAARRTASRSRPESQGGVLCGTWLRCAASSPAPSTTWLGVVSSLGRHLRPRKPISGVVSSPCPWCYHRHVLVPNRMHRDGPACCPCAASRVRVRNMTLRAGLEPLSCIW